MKFRHCLFTLLSLALVFALSGCITDKLSYDYKPGFNFSTLKTWQLLAPPVENEHDPLSTNTLLHDRIKVAIGEEMALRGYQQRNTTEKTDFLVTYYIGVADKINSRQASVGLGYSPNSSYWGGALSTGSQLYVYQEESLIIDFLSPDSKELLWRGTIQRRLSEATTPQERETKVRDAVVKVLAGVP